MKLYELNPAIMLDGTKKRRFTNYDPSKNVAQFVIENGVMVRISNKKEVTKYIIVAR